MKILSKQIFEQRVKMIKKVKIKIFGDVQGVFFRYSAKEKAWQLGLKGWAENADDGTVEITAEGEEENLKKFIDWCYAGPPMAKVEKTEIEWQEAKNEFQEFMIK